MAEIDLQAEINAPSEIGIANPFGASEREVAEQQTRENVDNATYGEKQTSFFFQAMKSNTVHKVLDWTFAPTFEEDPAFENSDDSTLANMKAYNIGMKHYAPIRDSKSLAEMLYNIRSASREDNIDNQIENTLTDRVKTTASIVGAVADVDLALGFGVGLTYKAGTSLAKIAAIEGVAEAGLATTHYLADEKYTLEDAAFDMVLGTSVAVGATKLFNTFDTSSTIRLSNEFTVQSSENAKWTTDALMADTLSAVRPANKYTTTAGLEDIRNTVLSQSTKNGVADRVNFEANFDEAVNKKFEAPEYAQYSANRANFFDTQKRINEITLGKQLDEINANIDTHTKSITDVEAKLAKTTNKAWKTRLKKELNESKQKLADEQSKLKVSLDKKPLTASELNFQRTVDDMVDDIQFVKKELDEIIINAKNGGELESLTATVNELHKRLPDEMQELYSKFKSAIKNKGFDGKTLKEDIIKSKRLTNKQKAIVAGALLVGGSNLTAAEDGNFAADITLGFMLTIATLALAPSAISKIKDVGVRSMVRNTKRSLEQAYQKAKMTNSPQANTARNIGAMIAQDAKTRLTSTVAPFEKAGGQAAKIIGDLLYSSKTGAGAETIKSAWAHSTLSKYSMMERQTFKMWKAENGITFTQNFTNDMNAIHNFRKLVTDNMEMRNSKSPSIIALTKQNDELMEHMWGVSKEYGVYGFEKIDYKAGMIPRLWRHDTMSGIVKQLAPDDKIVLRDALANAIYKTSGDIDTANKQADKFMDIWTNGFDAKRKPSNAEDVFGQVADMLKDDVDYKDFADRFNTSKDRSSRTKFRIDFDINDFEKVELDGGKFVIDKSVLVEREFKTILDQTANTMYGAAALARHGYTSPKALEDAIAGVDDASLRNELTIASDLVRGVPVASNSKQVHELSMIAKDLTIVAKLPLVVFSLPPEFAFTLANAGVSKGVRALIDSVMSTFGKDSQMMSSLSDISGLSTSVSRMDWSGYRAVTNDLTEMDDMGIVSKIREGTVKMRDASMIVNGLSYFSDTLQRANMALNAEKFANFIIKGDTNPTSGINPSRLKSFGIDDDTADLFKEAFEFNEKGRLKAIDTKGWTNRQKDKFAEVLRDMNQQVTPETTIGETGLWTRSTDIGRILSTLTSYPMQQFNVHGLEDLRHLDRMSLMHSAGGFAGSYIGLHARYAVQDKEIDDEKMVMYALMNMPLMGGLSAMSSIVAPATQDTVKDGLSVIGLGQ